jgi:hypothetical protein
MKYLMDELVLSIKVNSTSYYKIIRQSMEKGNYKSFIARACRARIVKYSINVGISHSNIIP